MSNQIVTPTDVAPPPGAYSHAVATRGAGTTLYISGQLGVDPDGNTPTTFAKQATQCWRNIVAILATADMTVHDLVNVTTFLTNIDDAGELASIREPFLDGARPASSLIAAAALVLPEWQIEVEATAFKADKDQVQDPIKLLAASRLS